MSFIVNKEKLKDNFLKHIRNERAKEFEKLDIEYQRADEVNDASAKATIIQKKNELRDFPATITNKLSHSLAIFFTAACLFVVA